MRPTDVLAHKRIMHEWAADQLREHDRVVADLPESADLEGAEVWREMLHDLHFATGNGEVYWVSADMTAVAKAAAHSMPVQTLRVDDLPSRIGFLLYDEPIAETCDPDATEGDDRSGEPIVGFAWAIGDPRPYWSDAESRRAMSPVSAETNEAERPPDGYSQWVKIQPLSPSKVSGGPTLMPAEYIGRAMAWEIGGEPMNDEHDVAASLLATWTLMQQFLTVSERTSGDRAERRRCARAGLSSDVLVVRLRRRHLDSEQPEDAEEGGVAWSHRWLVGGHWRNQWLPSRQAHRLQWIAPYVKGPANKPLVIKDRISAWVR